MEERKATVTFLGKLGLNPTRLLWEMSAMNPRIIPAEWEAWDIYLQAPLAPCWGPPPGNIKSTGFLHCSVQAEKAPSAAGELQGKWRGHGVGCHSGCSTKWHVVWGCCAHPINHPDPISKWKSQTNAKLVGKKGLSKRVAVRFRPRKNAKHNPLIFHLIVILLT